jgi:signal transduction histidine kinase
MRARKGDEAAPAGEQMKRSSSPNGVHDGPAVVLGYPPRVRIEWVVAAARVVLAGGALIAVAIDPGERLRYAFAIYLLGWYLVYSLGMLALVWAPNRFARGWDVAVHLFDFAAFSLLMLFTQGANSPFFMCFLFLLVVGTVRWQVRGTLWTAAGTMAVYAAISLYAVNVLRVSGFDAMTFVIRTVYLSVITILLAFVGAHQFRFQREIGHLAAWPRRISRDAADVIDEVLTQAGALLEAPRLVLVWEDPAESVLNIAWRASGKVEWLQEADTRYEPVVAPGLAGKSFQVTDAALDGGRVVVLTAGSFRRRDCAPIHEALRSRFDMHAVQSWPLDGELIRGRMFCLDKTRMQIDDLVLGELVARLAVARLENLCMVARLRDASALEERVRVARDLHDSLLQSQAGAALQLLAARRLLDRDATAARERLKDVQDQLERGELEMRSFIRDLRPAPRGRRDRTVMDLGARLDDLQRRVERQWQLRVDIDLHPGVGDIPDSKRNDVYRLVQEALVNAARHAEASRISVTLSVADDEVHLDISDDGRGFPFRGTYDLARLNEMDEGPRTLKERVAHLAGDLTLKSMDTGTALRMRVPFAHTD